MVVPLVGTWIEMKSIKHFDFAERVVPLVGTWIEISLHLYMIPCLRVVPLVGTWIEIKKVIYRKIIGQVVPLVGTWIEIFASFLPVPVIASFPLWERGLKLFGGTDEEEDEGRSPCGNVD